MCDQLPPSGWVEVMLDWVGKICALIASLAVVVLVVTFGWLVFGRYVLNETPTWVEQLALLLICYIVFLGAVSGMKDETHLGVTLFRDMLPTGLQKIIIIAIDVMLAVFGFVMLLAGIKLVQFGWDSLLPMLDIPESYRTLAITTCGALTFGICAIRAILRTISFSRWQPLPDSAPSDATES
ncbi:TRAP transporter small permease [Gymnodinialimonas ulvae]|uniref:TRAP transporter small permease n=1 Tax=Gymnodinialimonas ulvae TaxID=3126504 RepID=UPI0030AA7AD6